MKPVWRDVTTLSTCPVCGQSSYCSVSRDKAAAICSRTQEGSTREIKGSGYLHIFRVTAAWQHEVLFPHLLAPLPEHNKVLAIRARGWIQECEQHHITLLAERFRVTCDVMRDMNVGWDGKKGAWTIPLFRDGKRVIGVELIPKDGKPSAVRGSVSGLYIPNSYDGEQIAFVATGFADMVALLNIGVNVVGRQQPDGTAYQLLDEVVAEKNCIVMSNSDGMGYTSSRRLTEHLDQKTPTLMQCVPEKYKTVRGWIHNEEAAQVYAEIHQVARETWG